jgi:hypothetical protein
MSINLIPTYLWVPKIILFEYLIEDFLLIKLYFIGKYTDSSFCLLGKVSKQWYERFVVFGMKLTIKGINTCVVGIILFVSCPGMQWKLFCFFLSPRFYFFNSFFHFQQGIVSDGQECDEIGTQRCNVKSTFVGYPSVC